MGLSRAVGAGKPMKYIFKAYETRNYSKFQKIFDWVLYVIRCKYFPEYILGRFKIYIILQ